MSLTTRQDKNGNPLRKGARQDVKQPPILFDRTQAILHRIEETLGFPCMTYWNSVNGSVCQNDVIGFHEVIRRVGARPHLGLFIKSEGGTGTASLRIVHLLREFAGRLTALVPLDCASAATMLALGADEIRMGPLAYLTAIDTSIIHELSPVDVDNERVSVGHDELTRVVRLWREEMREGTTNPFQALYPFVHPMVIGAVDRASSLSIMLCKEILSYHMEDSGRAESISRHLNSDYPAHSYPITLREAKRTGLNVHPLQTDVNDLLLELNSIYSEMGQRAQTDYDEENYHDNEILNIIEGRDLQLYYQRDSDWHYRKEERRWTSLNDESSWRRVDLRDGRIVKTTVHVR